MKFPKLAVVLAMALTFSACGSSYSDADMNSEDFLAMDTYISLAAYGEGSEIALANARREIKSIEALLSVTDPDSEVYRINAADGETAVSEDTAGLINFALYLNDVTEGAFDITLYPVSKEWGFTTGEYKVPDGGRIEELLKNTGCKNIIYADNTISLPEGYAIDLGALGKGFAGDRAAAVLKEKGVTSALLNLGGNIQLVGAKPDGSPWSIGIQNPFGEGNIAVLKTSDKAVVTSGGYQRYFEAEGKRYCHIIDPATGYPVDNGLASVTVVAASGLLCDGLSTALFVTGEKGAVDFWRQQGDFDMIIVTEDQRVLVTEGIFEDCSGEGLEKLER
ncbi:MAG: FAD:protein FMN transferase [Firmicutes bacterium]|nr:FAD:protein FMN transferase [[Eubacterium] siraeum]MCM1488979.1 FAD:protein FMN transferase [Bacillota bacterium]